MFEDVTITSLKLRGFGGSFTSTWEGGGLDLADYRGGKFPTVVLKDGTEIRLNGNLGFYDSENQGKLIPLGEVAPLGADGRNSTLPDYRIKQLEKHGRAQFRALPFRF